MRCLLPVLERTVLLHYRMPHSRRRCNEQDEELYRAQQDSFEEHYEEHDKEHYMAPEQFDPVEGGSKQSYLKQQ